MRAISLLIALTLGAPAFAQNPSRRAVIIHRGAQAALFEWSDGRSFGFEECRASGCRPVGQTRDLTDRPAVARRLAETLRLEAEVLNYADDIAWARKWYAPGALAGAALAVGVQRHLKHSILRPRAIVTTLVASFFAGLVTSVSVYLRRADHDQNATVNMLTDEPLLAEGLVIDDQWTAPAAAIIWRTLTDSIARATTVKTSAP